MSQMDEFGPHEVLHMSLFLRRAVEEELIDHAKCSRIRSGSALRKRPSMRCTGFTSRSAAPISTAEREGGCMPYVVGRTEFMLTFGAFCGRIAPSGLGLFPAQPGMNSEYSACECR